jgi:hypothetical protein
MVDSSVRFQPSTLPEAARVLGVSESTVRRLVKAGKLEAEQVLRPQGYVWMVKVPAPATDPLADPPRRIGASPANPPASPESPALAAWLASVLEPLMAELGTGRQRIEVLARENGRLVAELDAAGREIQALTAPAAPEARDPIREPLRVRLAPYAPWLLATLAIVAVVALVVVPR